MSFCLNNIICHFLPLFQFAVSRCPRISVQRRPRSIDARFLINLNIFLVKVMESFTLIYCNYYYDPSLFKDGAGCVFHLLRDTHYIRKTRCSLLVENLLVKLETILPEFLHSD
jgi:hypothetical protein